MHDIDRPKNFTCNGKCSRCGECCTPLIPITLKEYKTIKKYIKKHDIKPSNTLRGDNFYVKCCFYDFEEKKCKINEVKPEVCKNFMCNSSKEKIEKDIKYYDKRADINGEHIDRFVPMDLLFYDYPIMLLMILSNLTNFNNENQLIERLKELGSDRKFFEKNNITSTYEVAEAIEDGRIKLDWERD